RWDQLESLLDEAGRRPEGLGGRRLLQLAALYRAAAADLVAARRRFPSSPLVQRLETLVRRGQALLYERASRRGNLLDFFADRYWQLLWDRRRVVAWSTVILLAPAILMASWARSAPEVVTGMVPPEFLWVTQ